MLKRIPLTTVSFPEIRLEQRAAAHLRGYFGNYFREHSPLLHNHYEDGSARYRYPLIQYKVVSGIPYLVGLEAGAKLLAELFFQMKSIRIGDRQYPVLERDIEFGQFNVGVGTELFEYRFDTLWMALNQTNYPKYRDAVDAEIQKSILNKTLTANILSFFKGVELYLPAESRIMMSFRPFSESQTGFKNQLMLGINGSFTTNAVLPDKIGLGKSVSRGYGSISAIL